MINRKMNFRLTLFTILILSLALSACGGGDDGGDPTKPVKDFFEGLADMDAEKAAKAVCEEHRKDTEVGLDMLLGFLALAGDDAKIEISGLELKAEDKSDDEAMIVATGGTMKMVIGGEVQEETELGGEEAIKVVKEDGEWYVCDESLLGDFAP